MNLRRNARTPRDDLLLEILGLVLASFLILALVRLTRATTDATPLLACNAAEPSGAVALWRAFRGRNVEGVLHAFAPDGEVPTAAQVAELVAASPRVVTLTRAASCPSLSGHVLTFYVMRLRGESGDVDVPWTVETDGSGAVVALR